MIIQCYICDECRKEVKDAPYVTINGKYGMSTGKSGILLPRHQFEFCSPECLRAFSECLCKHDSPTQKS